MSTAKTIYFFLYDLNDFYFFFRGLNALARVYSTMLNRSRESGHLVLFLILEKRLLFTIMYDVCVYSLSLSFLQPSSKPCWFSKQLRESCIPGVRSQGWGAYYVVQTPPHKEHSQACGISLLFCVFTSSVGPNVIASPPL